MRTRVAVAAAAAGVIAVLVAASFSGAAVVTSHSGWNWGSPQPQGNTLGAIEFAGGRGYAAGAFGTILRTDDGGGSWSGIRSGTTVTLTLMRVIDADTFLTGAGCMLLRSDDGGTTVRQLRFSPSRQCSAPLAAFSFASSDVGYLLRSDGSVLRTADGGQRFTSRTPLPLTGGAPTPPNDIWFTSATDGIAVTGADVAGRIYRTTDGGGTWNQVAADRALKSVFFTDASNGYAVGDGVALKTADGGATWNPVDAPDIPILTSVRCGDQTHCVVADSSHTLFYTDDGFTTLQRSTQAGGPVDALVNGNAASYSSSSRVVAVGNDGDTRHSDDAGKSFSRDYLSVGLYGRPRATSAAVVHASGAAGKVARSTDGGESWSIVGVPTTGDIADVSFPSAALGYALDGQGSLFRTDNGGDSWAILGQPGPGGHSALWSSSGGKLVLIVGPFGVRRSDDGGQTFVPLTGTKVADKRLYGYDAAGKALFLYGPKVLLTTNDDGATLTRVNRPRRLPILRADFVNHDLGYVLTSDRRLWRTSNGGRRWRELAATGPTGAYDLVFGDSKHGWLAMSSFAGTGSHDAWVLHTSDGGRSWRPQLIDDNGIPGEGLAAVGDTTGFAIAGGNLVFTRSGGDAGSPSRLSFRAKGLKKHQVRTAGVLKPKVAGATVAVFARQKGSKLWRHSLVTTDSKGRYAVTWTVKGTSVFVAQWAGNQALRSAGSPAVQGKPIR